MKKDLEKKSLELIDENLEVTEQGLLLIKKTLEIQKKIIKDKELDYNLLRNTYVYINPPRY